MPLPDLNQHRLNFLSARRRAEPSKQTNKPQTGQKTHICIISRKQRNGGKGSGEEGDKHSNKDSKKESHSGKSLLPWGWWRTDCKSRVCRDIIVCFSCQKGFSLWNMSSWTAEFSSMINEQNYVLFLKCVGDSSCGLPPVLRIRAAGRHIWLQAASSLGVLSSLL